VDPWAASTRPRRDLARAFAEHRKRAPGRIADPIFQRRLREHGLEGTYCLLLKRRRTTHDLREMRCVGLSRQELLDRLGGPNTLLNLSYSIHPPLLSQFEENLLRPRSQRNLFWMTRMELGQSFHDEFWTIGLNVRRVRLPLTGVRPQMANILSAGRYD
jgi:hypothetical protein